MERKNRRPLRIVLRVLAALLALLLLFALALVVIPLTEHADKSPVDGAADWMARLDDGTPLNRVVLPGTHDSATQYVQLAFFSRCQSLDIGGQLEAGFRYLDIRLAVGAEAGTLKLMHGFTECRTGVFGGTLYLDAVLAQCYAFLDAHPTETIVFAVKQEHGDESVRDFETALDAVIAREAGRWLLTDTIPTVGEARGKLVLLRRYEDEAGLGAAAGIGLLWADQNGHDDVSAHAAAEDNGSYTLWVQDRYEYGAADKWAAFTAGMEAAGQGGNDLAIHFLSTKGTAAYGHPYSFARKLDPLLLGTDSASLSGWIVVDFASPKLAEHIYAANF